MEQEAEKTLQDRLRELICGSDARNPGQVHECIIKEMRPQEDAYASLRSRQLGRLGPKYATTRKDDGTTHLVDTAASPINNNPLYLPNMVMALNTPFDHIDRILLQDFSEAMGLLDADDNYFKGLFKFTADGFTMEGDDFNSINERFGSGGFVVDSFTYTPFIDYSTGDDRVGIYSDQFLNDYNSGRYEGRYHGTGGVGQWDAHRHQITSTMFKLGNLERDLEESKTRFREALSHHDGGYKQVYLHLFCEHLANLFAKLSNVRMCHEIYGFQPPHHEWEGILALDVWYNMLYRNIDAEYPFDETKLNMNPMQVVDGRHVWDNALWEEFKHNASKIATRRGDCVTPRGVLGKIYAIVK